MAAQAQHPSPIDVSCTPGVRSPYVVLLQQLLQAQGLDVPQSGVLDQQTMDGLNELVHQLQTCPFSEARYIASALSEHLTVGQLVQKLEVALGKVGQISGQGEYTGPGGPAPIEATRVLTMNPTSAQAIARHFGIR